MKGTSAGRAVASGIKYYNTAGKWGRGVKNR